MSISSRITQMEQHISNAYDGLEDLGIDLTNVDKNIDNISSMLEDVWDEYPKVTATDVEEATINGTKKGRMEIDLKGQTSQATVILPSEYQQVEYIQSSGVEYINTGYILNSNTSKIIVKSKTINGSNNFRCLFGYENEYTNRFFLRFNTDNSGHIYAPTNYTINNMQIDNINNIEIDISNNKTKCNGTETATSININNSPLPLFIFTLNYQRRPANDNFSTMQLYTFQVYENNSIVRNLIPCYRKSDNEIGLYDTVTNTFLTNAGTGTFAKGDNVTIPTPDFPQPIKNVTGQANVKIQNKNLWNILQEKAGTSVTTTDNIVYNLVPTSNNRTYDIIADENTAYTADFDLSANSSDIYIYFIYADDTRESVGYMSSGSFVSKHINKTSNSNKTLVGIKIDTYSLSTNNNYEFNKPILCKGTYTAETIPSYVPHQEQNLPFTFAEGQFLADDGKLQENGIYNEFQKIIFDGTENVLPYEVGDNYDGFAIKIKNTYLRNAGDRTSQKYNYFIELGHSPAYGREPNKATLGTDGYLYVFFEKNVMANATAVQTWLANNYANNKPLIAIGKVQNPTPIPYNATQQAQYNAIKQARSYDDQTNISSTSDELAFKMDVEILSNGVSSSNTRTLALENLNEVSLNKGSLNNIKEVDTEDTEDETSVESEE